MGNERGCGGGVEEFGGDVAHLRQLFLHPVMHHDVGVWVYGGGGMWGRGSGEEDRGWREDEVEGLG